MCGIVGMVGTPTGRAAASPLLQALSRLEYRGYDSAGIATLLQGRIECRKSVGKLHNLALRLAEEPIAGTTGIAHTRWATHGKPSLDNAHPIVTSRLAVVHNGIIENFGELRTKLGREGYRFQTETDTETLAVLITRLLDCGMQPQQAIGTALPLLKGSFAFAMLFTGHDDLMICARRGAPLLVGKAPGGMFVGSDASALAGLADSLIYLDDGDWACVRPEKATVFDSQNNEVHRMAVRQECMEDRPDMAGHPHYMKKEIFEQPAAVAAMVRVCRVSLDPEILLPGLPIDLDKIRRIKIVACGTSFHAGLIGRYWIEQMSGIAVDVEIASEFRYRPQRLTSEDLALFVSQSGETADTLAALKFTKETGVATFSVVNQSRSSMARESHGVLVTPAGPEIGVASTKAFTAQLTALACLAIAAGRAQGRIDARREEELITLLEELPGRLDELLGLDEEIASLGRSLAEAREVIYIGRGTSFPLALEGALKLKEISYIHAEGHAAGELKHGPIALVDDEVYVVALAPPDPLFDKTLSNVEETMARGAKVIMICEPASLARLKNRIAGGIAVRAADPFLSPLLYAVPLQLLAYHTAVARGTDVDQPRNLAKSVTVE